MNTVWALAEISLHQGLVYALVVLGVALSFRLLDFPDLTVDGSFTLGGAVVAAGIAAGWGAGWAMLVAIAAGALSGVFTGVLHTQLRINRILSGFLVMSVLYTVNLRVMGKPNVSLLNVRTALTPFEEAGLPGSWAVTALFAAIALVTMGALSLFLKTEVGIALRATGDNPRVVRAIGIDTRRMILLGMGMANVPVALAGALVAQSQGFADVGMGTGMIIIGLASLLVGESLFRCRGGIVILTVAAVCGSVVYQLIISVALRLGLAPTDLKLATGLMVIAALALRFRANREGAET